MCWSLNAAKVWRVDLSDHHYPGEIVPKSTLLFNVSEETADWERELQQELQEYEVVADADNRDDNWDKEIEEMLQADEWAKGDILSLALLWEKLMKDQTDQPFSTLKKLLEDCFTEVTGFWKHHS